METAVCLIGSGGYGAYVQQALADHPIRIPTIEKDKAIDFTTVEEPYVIVATPNFTHASLVTKALEADKHVLCEKPLALTAAEVTNLFQLAKEKQRYLGVGFVLINHPFYQQVKSMQKQLGPIKQIRVFNHATESLLEPEWYWNKEKSGGWFLLSEIHWYHLFAWLTEAESLTVLEATEETRNDKTVATWSKVKNEKQADIQIDHRLDMSYDTTWTKVEIEYSDGTIVIDDWVPRSCTLNKSKKTTIVDSRRRDDIYKDLILTNLNQLIESKTNINPTPIILAHSAAEQAQKLSDR